MPQVKAMSEVPNARRHKVTPSGHERWRTGFIEYPQDKNMDGNVAFMQESSPGHSLRTHFHTVDQFQIIAMGDGSIGRHPLHTGSVHFTRAYTPYGPLKHGDEGLAFITLRAHRDPGAQRLPECLDALKQVPHRNPWQLTETPDFDITPDANGVAIKAMEKMRDDRGLAGWSCVLKPGVRAPAPRPGRDGQYIVVLKGGLVHLGELKKGLAVVWVGKDEGAFQLEAGPEGCHAVIVNFPEPGGGIPAHLQPSAHGDYRSHQCHLCAYVYDEAAGAPDAGIPAGTRWAEVPEDFSCPDCDARKADFSPIEL